MKNKYLNKFSSFLYGMAIIIFIQSFDFTDNPPSGWYQQFLPDLNNRPLADIEFLDSLTGYGITGDNTVGDTNFIIKTNNGGDNWVIVHTIYHDLSSIKFLNQNTGFVCGGFNSVQGIVIKTTDGGNNWVTLNTPFANHFDDMSVLNEDTILVVDDNGFNGGVFRTTNGGTNWSLISVDSRKKIYMLNGNVGFSCDKFRLSKTTNGGFNWSIIPGENGFVDISFSDSLTGWKTLGDSMKFSSNGGMNWTRQVLPSGGQIQTSVMTAFQNLNKDTIWGCGGWVYFGNNQYRGILYRTTNMGYNWYYQLPDTTIHIASYEFINFFKTKYGWAYSNFPNYITGIYTNVGGDTTFITNVMKINTDISLTYVLHQNYPNPFNPKTIIGYNLQTASYIVLKVFDLTGREIKSLVNKKQNGGPYKIEFDGSELPSGVYFYKLEAEDAKGNIFSETKKMILLR